MPRRWLATRSAMPDPRQHDRRVVPAHADRGQGPRSGRGRPFSVAAEVGQDPAFKRDYRREVHQQTRGPADGRLEGLIDSIRVRALRGVQRRPGCVHVTVGDRHKRPRQAQPWTGGGQPGWQRREPPRYGSPFTAQDELVHVLLDQPGGLGAFACGQRMPDGVVGKSMLF